MRFLLREKHPKTDEGHNQPAGNAQAGNRDAEGAHHHLTGIPGNHQDNEYVHRGHQRLFVALLVVHIASQPEEQRNGRQRVRQR